MSVEQLSDVAMVSCWVLYLVAMICHAVEWGFARTAVAVTQRQNVPAVVGGVADHAGREDGVLVGDVADNRGYQIERFGRIGVALALVGTASNVVGVVCRGIAADRFPWGNMYEFLTTATAFIMVAYMVAALRFGMRWMGLLVTLVATVAVGLAVTVFHVEVAPLVPALHSVWFIIHIVTAVIGTAGFTLGGLLTIVYLVKRQAEKNGPVRGYLARVPSLERLDLYAYRLHAFAFPLWTFTLAAGAIWAQYAWSRYWNWDPKETWTLITWVVYAAYLHARSTAGWKGMRAAVIAIIGLVTLWFNFIGVNLLFSGMHSYAGI